MVLTILTALALSAPEKPKLAVLDVQGSGVAPELVTAITESMTQEATRRGFFDVIASSDIRTLLGMERQKQLMGCSEGSSCTAELAGALGARFVLSGTLTRLGEALQLTLQTLDTQKAQPIGRSIRIATDVRELVDQLPFAVAEATATPLPQPPSRVLPVTLVALGGAALLGGAILGGSTILEENGLNRDLSRDPASGAFLRYAQYVDLDARLSLQRTISLIGLIAGGALIGAGTFFFIRPIGGSSLSATLLPTTDGMALAGVW